MPPPPTTHGQPWTVIRPLGAEFCGFFVDMHTECRKVLTTALPSEVGYLILVEINFPLRNSIKTKFYCVVEDLLRSTHTAVDFLVEDLLRSTHTVVDLFFLV